MQPVNAEGTMKETISTVFEGLISLSVLAISAGLVNTHSDNVAVVGFASGLAMAVVTFWFGQRGQVKAVNGNITALSNIARQVSSAREEAAVTATNASAAAFTLGQNQQRADNRQPPLTP